MPTPFFPQARCDLCHPRFTDTCRLTKEKPALTACRNKKGARRLFPLGRLSTRASYSPLCAAVNPLLRPTPCVYSPPLPDNRGTYYRPASAMVKKKCTSPAQTVTTGTDDIHRDRTGYLEIPPAWAEGSGPAKDSTCSCICASAGRYSAVVIGTLQNSLIAAAAAGGRQRAGR
jgi:hypothetical protein